VALAGTHVATGWFISIGLSQSAVGARHGVGPDDVVALIEALPEQGRSKTNSTAAH